MGAVYIGFILSEPEPQLFFPLLSPHPFPCTKAAFLKMMESVANPKSKTGIMGVMYKET